MIDQAGGDFHARPGGYSRLRCVAGGYNFKWGHRVIPDARRAGMIYVTTFGGSVFHGPAGGTGAAFDDIVPTPDARIFAVAGRQPIGKT